MAYEKQTWNNNDPATPLNATRLNHMEDGIADGFDASTKATRFISISSYLAPGQALPNDGVLDAAPLINSALNSLITDANGSQPFGAIRYVLDLGPGRFRLLSTIQPYSELGTKKNIGLRGAGKNATFLLPEGPTTAILFTAPADTTKVAAENCYFGDFTIDMKAATLGPNGESRKGFIGRGWMDCELERVDVNNSPASAFGNDFPIRTTFTACRVNKTGLGVDGPLPMPNGVIDAAKYHSGFGIGTGVFPEESALFDGCTATNCYRGGFFLEPFENGGATAYRDGVFRYTNCRSWNNRIGFANVGGSGAVLVNCELSDNTITGYYGGVSAGVTAIASINTTMDSCQILRNGYGIYATGNPFDANRPPSFLRDILGGYLITNSRIEDNTLGGIVGENFRRIEPGGLTIRGNRIRRNGNGGISLRNSVEASRDVIVQDNYFDANNNYGVSLMLALTAPQINGNTFANSDGGTRQKDGIVFHPAEPVSLPMVRNNTFREMVRPLVNAARFDQTYIGGNREVSAAAAGNLRAYSENFRGGSSAGVVWPGGGWTKSTTGSQDNWTRAQAGISTAATDRSFVYRALASTATYVEVDVAVSPSGDLTKTQMLGVMLALDTGGAQTALIAGVNGADTTFTTSTKYAVWSLVAGSSTRLWESSVPATEAHAIALARRASSTLTDVYIDGTLVHTLDVAGVPSSVRYGVASRGVAGQDRALGALRAMVYAPESTPTLLRNVATNPGFEVPGGFAVQQGTGGAATATRPNDSAAARSGSFSTLVTWTAETTNPAGGGGNINTIENVTEGKVYNLSVWVKSSVSRSYRPSVNYYGSAGATGTFVGSKNGDYVIIPANVWTRLSVVSDALPVGTVSIRLGVGAAVVAANSPQFAVGDTVRFDDVMVTEGVTLQDYFDGSTNGGTWVGEPNASASTKVI